MVELLGFLDLELLALHWSVINLRYNYIVEYGEMQKGRG